MTTLAAGSLLAAAALPAAAADHSRNHSQPRSQVVLGAVQYDSPGRDTGTNASLNAEWVTVVNTSRRAVNLSGWTLSDADHHSYRFAHLRLAGHASVRVHTGTGRDTNTNVFQNRRAYVWNNDNDTATLRNDDGRVADTTSWDHQRGEHRGDGQRGGGQRGDQRGGGQRGDHRGGGNGDHRGRDHRGGDRDDQRGGGQRGDHRGDDHGGDRVGRR
nr:lamin tail domain-containing protein [Streptomyces sp. NBC_00899]